MAARSRYRDDRFAAITYANGNHGDGLDGLEPALALLEELPGGSVVRHLIERIPVVQARQARRMVAQLLDFVGVSETEVLARLDDEPRLLRLFADAARAAAQADTEAKLRALARLVKSGVHDDAKVDEARFIVGIVDELQVIHVRLLEALEALTPVSPTGVHVARALNVSLPIAQGLTAHLVRLALATSAGLGYGGVAADPLISQLGEEVLRLLRDTPVESDVDSQEQSMLPPWWRAVPSSQIEVDVRVRSPHEARAREVLVEAGFDVGLGGMPDHETVRIAVFVPDHPEETQYVYDAVRAVLAAARVDAEHAGSSAATQRPGFAYHSWARLLRDRQEVTIEGRPVKMLTGPDVARDRILERFASWLGADESSLTTSA